MRTPEHYVSVEFFWHSTLSWSAHIRVSYVHIFDLRLASVSALLAPCSLLVIAIMVCFCLNGISRGGVVAESGGERNSLSVSWIDIRLLRLAVRGRGMGMGMSS